MKRLLVGMSVAALIAFVQPPAAFAQHGASAHTPPPTSHATTTHGPTTHAATTHGSSSHSTTSHGPSTHATTTHGPSTHAPTTHGASAHGSSGSSHGSSKSTTHTNSKSTTTTTTTTTSGTPLTPVQQKLQRNTKLASKLQSLLPAGTNLMTAANGFRNFGQFVAAVHVSNNLGIPFAQLKTDMVTKGMSLGQSIQDLRPSANSTVEVETAEHEADVDIRTTTTTTTTTTRKRSHR